MAHIKTNAADAPVNIRDILSFPFILYFLVKTMPNMQNNSPNTAVKGKSVCFIGASGIIK